MFSNSFKIHIVRFILTFIHLRPISKTGGWEHHGECECEDDECEDAFHTRIMPPDGGMNQVKITGVFLPLIFWCLKMGENGGSVRPHTVGFHTDIKTPRNHHPILSTQTEYSLSDLRYEKPDRHTLPDHCSALHH